MPKPQSGALFDIKPVDRNGAIDVIRVSSVQAVVNLASRTRKAAPQPVARPQMSSPLPKPAGYHPKPQMAVPPPVVTPLNQPDDIKEEFESALNESVDLHVELARFGVTVARGAQRVTKPRLASKPILPVRTIDPKPEAPKQFPEFDVILTEIQRSRSAAARIPELAPMVALDRPMTTSGQSQPSRLHQEIPVIINARTTPRVSSSRLPQFKKRTLIIAGCVLAGAVVIGLAAWGLKQHVTAQGTSAVTQLENAKTDLENMNFDNASQDFLNAYKNFSNAGDGLNFMGATVSSLLGALPGGSAVTSAQNLVQIGKLVSDAGAAMTQAVKALADSGSLFTPGQTTGPTIASVMSKLATALAISSSDVSDIKKLLAETDASVIPEDKREGFDQLSTLVPALEGVVGHGADYAKFFASVAGQSGLHRYLILFQNAAELRPTGGFPGSYAVVTFKDGRLADFIVDDIYNPDGQIKEPVVPPGPLQHITPDWGMRDANWFPDFPTSARVIEDFYKKETGQTVEGVITVNPSLITDILKITGPIEMPRYHLTLDADNFVTTIQNQVEYVADRAQPKKVLVEFAPLLMDRLKAASSDQWLAIFNSLITKMDTKAVLMYFNNLNFETFADDQGFAGQIKQVAGDYLMPVISNVKGSKTDTVTDTSLDVTTAFEGTDAVHTLTITRVHNGGHEKYAFFNKQNPAYVRVLVPEGAQLVNIEGNNKPSFAPLLNYAKAGFATVDTLVKWQQSGIANTNGVTTYKESGKSEFGFWLITDPGTTKTVKLTYRVPNIVKNSTYDLYFQKQPGLILKDAAISAGTYSRSGSLEKDLEIKVQLP